MVLVCLHTVTHVNMGGNGALLYTDYDSQGLLLEGTNVRGIRRLWKYLVGMASQSQLPESADGGNGGNASVSSFLFYFVH